MCLLTDIEEVEHLLPVIFSSRLMCVMSFLMWGLHHCGACEAIGAQHLLQVLQFLLLPVVLTDSVCPVPKALDCSNQDPCMVMKVEVDVMVSMSFIQSTDVQTMV